jgi:transcriptional regulator with XRE-family HTH domain
LPDDNELLIMKKKIFLTRVTVAEEACSYFGVNLRFLRKKHGWTQELFADKIGIKRSLLGAYEEERAEPDLLTYNRICKLFKVSMEDMLLGDLSK